MSLLVFPELTIAYVESFEKWESILHEDKLDAWYDEFGNANGYGYLKGPVYHFFWPGFAHFQIDPVNQIINVHAPVSTGHERINDIYQRIAVPIYFNLVGYEVLHASAVLTRKGVIGFCAPAGTGKSSTVFGLSRYGYEIWADDALVLNISKDLIVTYPVPFQVRLFSDTGQIIQTIKVNQEVVPEPPNRQSIEKFLSQAPLAGLCMLERKPPDRHPPIFSARKLAPEEAFPLIFQHAFVYRARDPENQRKLFDHYLDILSQTPIYQVTFSTSLAEFDQYIQFLINHILVELD